jgi:ribosome-associated heat shock protein Hsp15
MADNKAVRADKFLWSVRIFKTRSMASEACRRGRVIINNIQAKPSRIVSRNDIIIIKKLPRIYSYKVIEPVEKRITAKMVEDFIEDITPEEEKTKLYFKNSFANGYREKGTGRPTKKERRSIDKLKSDLKHL